ncbi:MAG: hypothetical protein JO171_01300 [Paludibacterium sp.]|uniref:hypothetical protein n=1 Tax=Paludibacterium sp. TaxID=1917523 RepID=UPI0025FAC64A|nr:hypothetical protein [Paludibacterium sp.]MBV8045762.1 hypothetical protein [Paludibacterium sp.]MBV8648505.1 hypothetical protein [Paludibacterium sp.]
MFIQHRHATFSLLACALCHSVMSPAALAAEARSAQQPTANRLHSSKLAELIRNGAVKRFTHNCYFSPIQCVYLHD